MVMNISMYGAYLAYVFGGLRLSHYRKWLIKLPKCPNLYSVQIIRHSATMTVPRVCNQNTSETCWHLPKNRGCRVFSRRNLAYAQCWHGPLRKTRKARQDGYTHVTWTRPTGKLILLCWLPSALGLSTNTLALEFVECPLIWHTTNIFS
jgi:hypothetical protein